MNDYEKLVEELMKNGIELDESTLPNCDGIYRECPDYVCINVNGALPLRRRFTTLMHEIGHMKVGIAGTAGQIEHRANKYAVHRIIPWKKLIQAYSKGYETLHDLAEYFRVDEEFMRQALHIYGITI